MKTAFTTVVLALAITVLGACEQDLQERPPGTFSGSFRPPPSAGGGGGDDAGVDPDGGVPTRTVEGRVVSLEDLGVMPDRATGAAERQVGGFAPDRVTLLTTISTLDGSFTLPGLSRATPLYLSVSGDPPSYVVLETSRVDEAVLPIIDAVTLEDIAASVATAPGVATGHAFLWFEDGRGVPVSGLTVELGPDSPPSEGPFYGTGDRTQLTAVAPTASEGLVVLLNAVEGEVTLDVFRAEAPDTIETVILPVASDTVTFYEVTTAL